MRRRLNTGVLIPLLALTGCFYLGPCVEGDGSFVGEERDLEDFYSVTNTGEFNVYVTEGDAFYVEVFAQENLLPIIETRVAGEALIIEVKDGNCIRTSDPVEVFVTLPELEALRLSGSGKVIAEKAENPVFEISNSGSGRILVDTVYAQELSMSNSGSGKVEIAETHTVELELVQSGSGTVDAGNVSGPAEVTIHHSSSGRVSASVSEGTVLETVMTGSGTVELYGDVNAADYSLSSSGRIDALELLAQDARAVNTGSGNIYLWATGTLQATITGSGDIVYRGEPTINFQITGSGVLRSY